MPQIPQIPQMEFIRDSAYGRVPEKNLRLRLLSVCSVVQALDFFVYSVTFVVGSWLRA
jgi:hypothetical protein